MLRDEMIEHVFKRVEITGFCWNWDRVSGAGYGYVQVEGKMWRVHRLVYTLLVGPIPEGLFLDHLCRNRRCCNPDHLEPVTNQVNNQRGLTGYHNKIKTHCPHGHAYMPWSTYIDKTTGSRRCKVCIADNARKVRASKQVTIKAVAR